MDVKRFLDELVSQPGYQGQIVHIEEIPARPARFAEPRQPLNERLARALAALGIERLYTHQAAAIDAVRRGEDVAIVTSTASGKTLCYNIPVLEALLGDPRTRALYIFPTKALAQDQLKNLNRLLEADPALPVEAGTYDGDTPPDQRRHLRDNANIILTNPDMLHSGILPNHSRWAEFFERLRFVVLDEMHVYRGVFGSNVANVLRRLLRICRHYEAQPVFIACSATISNPGELAQKLIGRPVRVIGEELDGSPRGRKTFVLWNPPMLDKARSLRRSPHSEAQQLMSRLLLNNNQTICFTRARVVAELIHRYVQDSLRRYGPRWAEAVRAYRGGYTAAERREIERLLFSGELLGVCATNALELGIDIGSLDACVIVCYPGSIASTRQQAGRAGRGIDESLAVLVAGHDPIDQFLMRHPRYLFEKNPEAATVDPQNPYILAWHLRCAARELPLSALDEQYFGQYLYPLLQLLTDDGQLARRGNQWFWIGQGYPAADISLRTMTDNVYEIIDQTGPEPQTVGHIDEMSAFLMVHDQAIYLHQGETYFVRQLDLERKHAYVERVNVDYYTRPHTNISIRIQSTEREKTWRNSRVCFGDLTVTQTVYMFTKIKFGSTDTVGFGNLNLPPRELETAGLWLIPPLEALQLVRAHGRLPQDGLYGIAHVMVQVMPLFVMSDPLDVWPAVDSANTGLPTIFVYDKYPGGVGFSERAYEEIEQIMQACLSHIETCECEDGCLSCVGAPFSGYGEPVHEFAMRPIPDKEAALCLLHYLLEREPYIPKPLDPKLAAELEARRAHLNAQAAPGLPRPEPRDVPPPPREFPRLPHTVEARLRRHMRQARR